MKPWHCVEWGPDQAPPSELVFVSHRWCTPDHPDPEGVQLREVHRRLWQLLSEGRITKEALVFIDYSAMYQRPRTPEEDAVFHRDIASLSAISDAAGITIVLSEGFADYRNRAWCFFEAVAAQKRIHFFEDQSEIKESLSFLDMLLTDEIKQLTAYDLSYKANGRDAEIVSVVFQHLADCRLTHATDFPLIKAQLVSHFLEGGRVASFGMLMLAMYKFFDVRYALLPHEEPQLIYPRPWFSKPSWSRMAALGGGGLFGGAVEPGLFALSSEDARRIRGTVMPVLELTRPGVDDVVTFLQRLQSDPDWKRYVVDPKMLRERGDCFHTIVHVVHTVLEQNQGFFATPDRGALLFPVLPG